MRRFFPLALTILITIPTLAAAQERDDVLDLALYLEWEQVSDPQISPDGRQIVYTRRWVDKMKDRWTSSLWIMDADGGRNRFLVDGSSPRWSPDGTRIAFVEEGDPTGAQIFVRWMDAEGATTQITRMEESPSDLEWSPDGQSIAFTMTVKTKDDFFPSIRLPERPDGAEWTGNPKIVTRLWFRRDRRGYVDDGYRHVFVVPATGGTPRLLTDGDWNHGGIAWTPDGREILFSSLRVEDAEHVWRESEIYAVDVTSGSIRQLTTRRGPDGNPVVSPDGRLVAYTGYDWTDDTYITATLYVMGLDGSSPREISGDLDRNPRDLTWSADSKTL
ncbi:MAG: peptidase S9, partial [Gemmatimonas sp. SG8_28]